MGWSDPKTWEDGELVDIEDFNLYVRDNLSELKDPPSADYFLDESSDYTTSSTSFINVDATNLSLSIDTAGQSIFIGFMGNVSHSTAGGFIYFDVFSTALGDRIGGGDGLVAVQAMTTLNEAQPVSFLLQISDVFSGSVPPFAQAGANTFRLQWRTNAGTATLYAGAGTANYDVHGQFWAREMS